VADGRDTLVRLVGVYLNDVSL